MVLNRRRNDFRLKETEELKQATVPRSSASFVIQDIMEAIHRIAENHTAVCVLDSSFKSTNVINSFLILIILLWFMKSGQYFCRKY